MDSDFCAKSNFFLKLKVPHMYPCLNCGKENDSMNYCNWECNVELAKKEGGKVITPNGLPIRTIMHDGTMLEISHADHPDYKFPVTIEFIGVKEPQPEWDVYTYASEDHALLYCDRYVAITIYECRYFMFKCYEGLLAGDMNGYSAKEWRLTQESLAEIDKRFPKRHSNLVTAGGLEF